MKPLKICARAAARSGEANFRKTYAASLTNPINYCGEIRRFKRVGRFWSVRVWPPLPNEERYRGGFTGRPLGHIRQAEAGRLPQALKDLLECGW